MAKVAVIRVKRKHLAELASLVPGGSAKDVIILAVSLGLSTLTRAARQKPIVDGVVRTH